MSGGTTDLRRPRRRERGRGIKNVLKRAYNLGKKAIYSGLGKMLKREGLKYTPTLNEKRTKRNKNKSKFRCRSRDWTFASEIYLNYK